ncbi:MAG: sugar phosphate isomerase/epimerase [Phycisphaeraceae bacterium]|nr:sugar phosphate isomerase/epimerase [Phycisphaeraceae bacterium]
MENETQSPGGNEMNSDIREYAKLGLVHHMLYPECGNDPELHTQTLLDFIKRDDIETLDCCLPLDDAYASKLIQPIKECGKTVCFAIHFYPLRSIPLAAKTQVDGAQAWALIDDMINQAVSIGAEGFIFGSGIPSFLDAEEEDFAAFDAFCNTLCKKLAPHKITAMLEPFDTDIDKKFLYGPINDCVNLSERVGKNYDNFGLQLDMAHLPLMYEDFTSAIARSAPYLKRVHLGNCVLKDKTHPRWGDTHPPIGFKGGEIDIPELVTILRGLLDCGFLDKEDRGNLLIEMTPFPGKTVNETVTDNFDRLETAWRQL